MAATPEFRLIIKAIEKKATKESKANKKLFDRFKTNKPKGLDKAFKQANKEVFAKIDCLDCSNCCRVAKPVFNLKDARMLATHFEMTTDDFIKKYLKPDPIYEFFTKKDVCPFIGQDNKCSVYEYRPSGCRTYPPAKLRLSPEQLEVIHASIGICPAVSQMVEKIKEQFA